MAHVIVPEAEAVLDKEFPVLDHGFVRLVDYLGGDQRIVQAARVSYGAGTKSYRQDKGLIEYLLRNEHTSPFEQVILTFHTKMPIFVARQWVRHRTARLNEISGRYSVMSDEFYVPDAEHLSPQATDNKQGRSSRPFDPDTAREIQDELTVLQRHTYESYQSLLQKDVARELARINLPLSMYTEWYWQIDAHNLFRFLRLRLDGHAQYEIRAYAEVMHDLLHKVCPIATEAFDEHARGRVSFSQTEFEALQDVLVDSSGSLEDRAKRAAETHGISGRALERFLDKLRTGRMA